MEEPPSGFANKPLLLLFIIICGDRKVGLHCTFLLLNISIGVATERDDAQYVSDKNSLFCTRERPILILKF